jgi:hypothetical protein
MVWDVPAARLNDSPVVTGRKAAQRGDLRRRQVRRDQSMDPKTVAARTPSVSALRHLICSVGIVVAGRFRSIGGGRRAVFASRRIRTSLTPPLGDRKMMTNPLHRTHDLAEHDHVHGHECGHRAIPHDDHLDYLHHGHWHAPHDGHYDEHPALDR